MARSTAKRATKKTTKKKTATKAASKVTKKATKKVAKKKTGTSAKKATAKKISKKAPAKTTVATVAQTKSLINESDTNKLSSALAHKRTLKDRSAIKSLAMKELCKDCDKPRQSRETKSTALSLLRAEIKTLSPLRYPLDYDKVATQTTRISGLLFVMLGAFFTMYHAQFINGYSEVVSNQAQTVSSDPCDPQSPAYNPSDPMCTGGSGSSGSGGTQPSVDININANEPLAGIVPIEVEVPYADFTRVSVHSIDTGQTYMLGTAAPQGSDTYIANWNTTQYPDGYYRVEALVFNQYGNYQFLDTKNYLVQNIPPSPPITFTFDQSEPFTDTVTVDMTVAAADSLAVEVYEKGNSSQGFTLGNAVNIGGNDWSIDWDTTLHPDGEYKVYVNVTNPNENYNDFSQYFDVENNSGTAPGGTQTTSTGTSEPGGATGSESTAGSTVVPIIDELELSDDGDVSGELEVRVFTQDTTNVNVRIKPIGQSNLQFLGAAYEHNLDEWRYRFDTSSYPNGDYRLVVQAISSTGDFVTQGQTITFNNSNINTTNSIEPTTTDVSSTAADTTAVLEPEISVDIRATAPISGLVTVRVDVDDADFVEMYAQRKTSATKQFVGLATQRDSDRWSFTWNTTQSPNGEYQLFARAKTNFGWFFSDGSPTVVFNEVVKTTTEDSKSFTTLEEVALENDLLKPALPTREPAPVNESTSVIDDDDRTESELNPKDQTDLLREEEVDILLEGFVTELESELQRLAAAIRSDNPAAVEQVKTRIQELRNRIVVQIDDSPERDDLLARIDRRLETAIVRVQEDVEKVERIVRERTGESASKDTDQDGVTDFDEINLYKTDPFSADSDGDGFNDGAEVLGGFDPTDDTPEAMLRYESPKEVGVVREDILVVEEIVTVSDVEPDTDNIQPAAVITGKALPNSYVTLYIFSTPIVVTVKTEADGSWSYRFDKELEDGEHEVYVGITDNAGRIVAKSNPLTFVKTAEAFDVSETAAGASVAPTVEPPSSFLSENLVLMVLSLAVVGIGLILMMLGMHMQSNRPEVVTVPTDENAQTA